MARTGIVYSDVARAATKLVADGKHPTVDSVRPSGEVKLPVNNFAKPLI